MECLDTVVSENVCQANQVKYQHELESGRGKTIKHVVLKGFIDCAE